MTCLFLRECDIRKIFGPRPLSAIEDIFMNLNQFIFTYEYTYILVYTHTYIHIERYAY